MMITGVIMTMAIMIGRMIMITIIMTIDHLIIEIELGEDEESAPSDDQQREKVKPRAWIITFVIIIVIVVIVIIESSLSSETP